MAGASPLSAEVLVAPAAKLDKELVVDTTGAGGAHDLDQRPIPPLLQRGALLQQGPGSNMPAIFGSVIYGLALLPHLSP